MSTAQEREAACEAFLEPQGMGYIRSFDSDGMRIWTLFDDCGNARVISDNRSETFFFAAEHDIDVRMVN